MSYTFHLLCVDCLNVFDLGKVVTLDSEGLPVPPRYGGWRDQSTGDWLEGSQLHELIAQWLLLHRGHEIRLVPEEFLDLADPGGRLEYISSAADVFVRLQGISTENIWDADVPGNVATRLKAMVEK